MGMGIIKIKQQEMTGEIKETGDSRLRGNDGNLKSSVVLCVFSVKLRVIFLLHREPQRRHRDSG
jgi:hypothetical protein